MTKKVVLVEIDKGVNISNSIADWTQYDDNVWMFTWSWSHYVLKDYSYGYGAYGYGYYGSDGSGYLPLPERDMISKMSSFSVEYDFYEKVDSIAEVSTTENSYFFDQDTQLIYARFTDNTFPWNYTYITSDVIQGFSNHSDWYDNIYYDGRISSIPSINRSCDNLYHGVISFEDGSIQLINTDGHFDSIGESNIYGKKVRIYYGEDDNPVTQVYEGIVESFDIDSSLFTINTIDPRKILNKAIPSTNWTIADYPLIEESKTDEYIPVVYGKVTNIPVVCVEEGTGTYIFKIADREIKAIDTVYVNGTTVPIDSTDLTTGTFELSTNDYTLNDDVTADVQGFVDGSGNLIEHPIEVILDLLTSNTALVYDDRAFDLTDWELVRAMDLPSISLFIEEQEKLIEIVTDIAKSIFGNLIMKGNGTYSFKIRDLEKDPAKTVYITEQLDRFDLVYNTDEYLSSVKVGYDKDYSNDTYSYYLNTDYQSVLYNKYASYEEKEFETLLTTRDDAIEYSERLMEFFGGHYQTISIGTTLDHIDIELEDLIDVELYAYNNGEEEFFGTVRIVVTSVEHDLTHSKAKISGRWVKNVTADINLYKLLRWNTGKNYSTGGVTSGSGQLWRALKPSAGQMPEIGSEFWSRYLALNWIEDQPYQTGQLVIDEEILYTALRDNINKKPSENILDWTQAGIEGPQGPQGDDGMVNVDGGAPDSIYAADQVLDGGGP